MSTEKNVWKELGRLVFALATMVYAGWVASMLWGWFIIPFGAMPLLVPHAVGIDLLVSVIWYKSRLRDLTEEERDYLHADAVKVPTVVLGFGWLAHLWMVG